MCLAIKCKLLYYSWPRYSVEYIQKETAVKAKYISTYVEVDEVIMVVSVFEWTLESENAI